MTWRTLGQRLACHKWCYKATTGESPPSASSERGAAGGSEAYPDGGAPLLDSEAAASEGSDYTDAQRDGRSGDTSGDGRTTQHGHSSTAPSAPQGRWLRVVASGLRYATFGDCVLPFVDSVAAARPLTDLKGNNTASIGLIPIGLAKPQRRGREVACHPRHLQHHPSEEGDEDDDEEGARAHAGAGPSDADDDSDDLAIALHRKVFSAMGIAFAGDWAQLCEIMRPRGTNPFSTCALTRASRHGSPSSQGERLTSPHSLSSSSATALLPLAPSGAAVTTPYDTCTSSVDAPALYVFDAMPHSGQRRVMATCLSPGDTATHPNATAKLVEALFSTCSTIVIAAPDSSALGLWLRLVSPHMSFVGGPSPFSTADNTPNVVFMTSVPIPSLRKVLGVGVGVGDDADGESSGSASGSGSDGERAEEPAVGHDFLSTGGDANNNNTFNTNTNTTTNTTTNTNTNTTISGPAMRRPPKEAFSWILNRTSCVGEVVFGDASCPLSLKTLYAPAWVAPECSLPLPAPAIVRMLIAAGAADGGSAPQLWTREVLQAVCDGQARHCAAFYRNAMRTEIAEANRPVIAFTDLPVPLDPAEIVSLQDHFFYAALRSYAMAVRHASGSDTAAGMALLEEFKKDISTAFRVLWVENIATSRAYCTALFDIIFHGVHERFYGSGASSLLTPSAPASTFSSSPSPFSDKKGLHQWFSVVTDKISEYVIKAKGPRKMDVLAERIATRTVGGLQQFCLAHPDHPFLRIEDVRAAGAEVTQYCSQQLLKEYHDGQDELLSVKQRNSAMYTACLGTMWGAEAVGEAVKYLTMLGPEYDTWAQLLQLKREGFGLAPTAVLALRVGKSGGTSNDDNDGADSEGVAHRRRRRKERKGGRRFAHKEGDLGEGEGASASGGEGSRTADSLSETNSISASSDRQRSSSIASSVRGRGSLAAAAASASGADRGDLYRGTASASASALASPPPATPAPPVSSTDRFIGMLSSFWGLGRGGSSAPPTPAPNQAPPRVASSATSTADVVERRAPSTNNEPRQQQRRTLSSHSGVSSGAPSMGGRAEDAALSNNNPSSSVAHRLSAALGTLGDGLLSPEERAERRAQRRREEAIRKGECVLFTELEYERQALLQSLLLKEAEHKQRMETVGRQFNLRSDQTSDFNVIQREFSNGFKAYRVARKMEDAADDIAARLRLMRERVKGSFAATRE